MEDYLLLRYLKTCFYNEIANSTVFRKNEIIVLLADGSKAKIKTLRR